MDPLIKGLRTQNNNYNPPTDRKPLSQQLDSFNDILNMMGPDASRKSRSSSSQDVDQEGLSRQLANIQLPGSYTSGQGPPISLRLKPALGRTIALDLTRNFDLTSAFRKLERRCIQNNVKRDERSQRIYVRRGQRRKDEKSRRWRELFKGGFLHECGRIRRMKAQGW